MPRNLHITIFEGAERAPRGGTSGRRAYGWDPSSPEEVAPDPSDPDYPEEVAPDPNDPNRYLRGGWTWPGAAPAVATVHETGAMPGACCCCPSDKEKAAPPRPGVTPRDYSGFVIVRTSAGLDGLRDAESLWQLAVANRLEALQEVLRLELRIGGDGGGGGAEDTTSRVQTASLDLGARLRGRRDEPAGGRHGTGGVGSVTGDSGGGTGSEGGRFEVDGIPVERDPEGVLKSRPLVEIPRVNRAEQVARIQLLESRAATSSFPPLNSLVSYWRLDLRDHPDLVERVVEELLRTPGVDLAYREVVADDPQHAAGTALGEDQGYLDAAPVGIGARWARDQLAGVLTEKPRLCDLEQRWWPEHAELVSTVEPEPIWGTNRAKEGDLGHHGTAVLGQLAAASVVGGVRGAAESLADFYLASHYLSKKAKEAFGPGDHPFRGTSGHVAAAIVNLLAERQDEKPDSKRPSPLLEAGDVLLLEVQRGLLLTEIDAADFDAIRLASALGVIVVEAAGNGGVDLDAYVDPDTGRSFNRRSGSTFRDSGAIVVGAARSALPHDRAPFSNYGSRLDCFAWGDSVTTCGYGNLRGTKLEEYYTNTFSGTSSASPIIAGAAALVQGLHVQAGEATLLPRTMRSLLSNPATGTRQGPNRSGFIGIMPNLEAIVAGTLQIVPDLYLRRFVCDGGGAFEGCYEAGSSPDVVVWPPASPAALDQIDRANLPAPGLALDPADPYAIYNGSGAGLYVRLRNRGTGEGGAMVRVFASPAATLITPERWAPVGKVHIANVPQGDRLHAAEVPAGTGWRPGWPPSPPPTGSELWKNGFQPPASFLAVQVPEEIEAPPLPDWSDGLPHGPSPFDDWSNGLPPGPPYFDWAVYRRFLRGPGVAWRNVHPIDAGAIAPGQEVRLDFFLAGTPDVGRSFGFQVLQRLPAGAKVALQVPQALDAKLRQRLPILGNGGYPNPIQLARRPRGSLGSIFLPARACAPATLIVKVPDPSPNPLPGHSIAIRQLWRGEEVGRITWWFVEGQAPI